MVIDDSFHGSYGYNSEDEMSPLYPLDSSLLSESSFLTALASELMEVPDKDGIEVVKNTHAFKIGDFLLVEFDLVKSSKKRKYIAEILELAKGEDDEPLYKVKCLKRVEENLFNWPEIPDICNIAETKILKQMDPPEKVQKRRSIKMFFPNLNEETC
ncbi:uncharacterized protein LOC127729662 [Mytilus californianus]|uniref:uncharacterized protein LOC127729662 n=1 Tax=Mytilus californianus TaxID=6549 RepID=UPI00224867C4|nr:uncharacterized protein LOC127729662 [Mytilus californianus]